jgi:hypothetical protein
MYEEIKFDENGWLWTKSTPDGEWIKATAERTIAVLWELLKATRTDYRLASKRLADIGL